MADKVQGLDEQLREKLANTGAIRSSDFAAAADTGDTESPGKAFEDARASTSKIQSDEPVNHAGESEDSPEHGKSYDDRKTADKFLQQVQQIPDYLRTLFDPDSVIKAEVTPADKERYYESIIQNTRFQRTYRLMDGKITFTLQNLTEAEIKAYWAQYVHESNSAGLTAYEHRSRSRDLLLALSVCEFNGDGIEPVTPADLQVQITVNEKSGKLTRSTPAWVERAQIWAAQSPGLLALMFKCYREFEFVYWRLVAETKVENF